MRKFSLFFLIFFFIFSFLSHAELLEITEIDKENNPNFIELYRIKIENIEKGDILVSSDQGGNWQNIGKVQIPVTEVNPKGFSASRFGEIGKITAVAVNAIHIKTGQDLKNNRGVIFSLLPANIDLKNRSYNHRPSSLQTNISPQEGIFGGKWTPIVGNPVYLEQKNGSLKFIPPHYVPKLRDKLVILVLRPEPYPKEIVFENKFGGKIIIYYPNGRKKVIGQVLKPVQGVGRFIGSQYSGLSRIRANHSGVIDISTSLGQGKVGGFQIIPAEHGMDPEMYKARTSTQWMVVGPLSPGNIALDGLAPLFAYFILPRYAKADLQHPDWQKNLLKRTLVQAKKGSDSKWDTLPAFNFDPDKPLPPAANTALKDITEIKIIFPVLD